MSQAAMARRIKVARIIARLNVGGPAQHVVLLSRTLESHGFDTTLICGKVPAIEGDMGYYAVAHGVRPVVLDSMSREIAPVADWRSFCELVRLLRRLRPDIVHTHTAKAGFLGRLAARLAGVPVIVHTYHGHVLSGYFGRRKERLFRAMERLCGKFTTVAIAVGEAVRRDLVSQSVLPADRIRVVRLGLDLQRFADAPSGALRALLGVSADTPLIGYCGRLVPIKNVPLLLAAMEAVHQAEPEARLVVVGDGELRADLEEEAGRRGLAEVVSFLGWRSDTDRMFRDLDVMALSSRNEGTPVALIEAGAAGVAAVSTDVGGVGSVVADGETGWLVPDDDAPALAAALIEAIQRPDLRRERGRRAQERMLREFGVERLTSDIAGLYADLLARNHAG